jgi:excisionase family DNA binding protein
VGRLLTPREVADLLRVSLDHLKGWRCSGTGPRFVRLGHRTVRYDEASVEQWLRERQAVRS